MANSSTSELQFVTFTSFSVLLYIFFKDPFSLVRTHATVEIFVDFINVLVFGPGITIPSDATWA